MERFAVSTKLRSRDLKALRKKLGLTQAEFAGLVNVSAKTIERWETSDKPITGPIVTLAGILNNYPQMEEELIIPEKEYSLRLWYMCKDVPCTLIDVEERSRKVHIKNYQRDYIMTAFGRNEHPTFEDYEEFLKSRCFPETRDKMKLMLKELDLPFYDPFLVIEKTEGRMAEDDFWIKIER
ncbi:MAG: helix-turn-helix domain-containing protein [Lachnospiraceae bacterium]